MCPLRFGPARPTWVIILHSSVCDEAVTDNLTIASVPESRPNSGRRALFHSGRYQCWLLVLFLLSLPFVNPWVHGDGVGYYAYARALLIQHRLDFRQDWRRANESFVIGREDSKGQLLPDQFTSTGHLKNIWTVGPALLWAPFLAVAHAGVVVANHLGAHVAADGFSAPYRTTMALATAFYGFLALWISFLLSRKYFDARWAFLATLGIWAASSLPVYMYFNPAWSHAHSAFAVALFVWYWHRTREHRTSRQWVLLGLLSGLLVDVYYPNGIFLLIPLMEGISQYFRAWRRRPVSTGTLRLFFLHLLYFGVFLAALLPTLVSRRIIFGSALQTGYYSAHIWRWTSPALWDVLFSSDHGLFSWTPVLILALFGLFLFRRVDRSFADKLIVCCVAFYLMIACYPDWDGLSSFGNRFFVSLTPLFVLGLAAFFDTVAQTWNARRAAILATISTTTLILWNFGMMFQWGMHLIPVRGPVSWRETAYNQVTVVPEDVARTIRGYFVHRGELMRNIEDKDLKQLRSHPK